MEYKIKSAKEQRTCKYQGSCKVGECNGRSQQSGVYHNCYQPLPKIIRGDLFLKKGLLKKL
ncbi:MAG: hypothetical protein QT05_C0022G0009 [archaeon GW2011_AR13]|nr:MAG: hypothetical protein QT05_C0022G0009 [archaeon GW2011_AR13]HIG95194.1 hypothetical protein [Nanoarchaeota archaeon]HIH63903.1 hypothetical protein [Nanoarchaeota archaeon]HIJ09802.1 hypothetical protein [Nanoarchaeota archaeon]